MRSDDDPVPVASVRTDFEANVIAESLRSRGVEARVISHSGAMLSAYNPSPNAIQVLVRAGDEHRARAALEEARSDSLDIAWDEIDVGEPEDALAARRPLGVRRWMRGTTLGALLFTLAAISIIVWQTPFAAAVIIVMVFLWLMGRQLMGAPGKPSGEDGSATPPAPPR